MPLNSKSTNSRPPWNPSTTVNRKSGLPVLPGKKKQFADIQNRIREHQIPPESFNRFRHRNDSSGVAACIYTSDHQTPWPSPKQFCSSTELSEERKPHSCP